jgi:hypothetical protein
MLSCREIIGHIPGRKCDHCGKAARRYYFWFIYDNSYGCICKVCEEKMQTMIVDFLGLEAKKNDS